MKMKIALIIILFVFLSASFILTVDAQDFLYAKKGVVVYPTYILKTVCYPYMPCGIQRIDIPNNIQDNDINTDQNIAQNIHCTNSPSGFFRIFSPTYDPITNTDPACSPVVNTPAVTNHYNNQYYKNQNNYNKNQPTVKHFPNMYNTRNNYDSRGNWIGDSNKKYNNPDIDDFHVYIKS